MDKKKVSNEGMENTIHSTKQYLGLNQIEGLSEHLIAEHRARKTRLIAKMIPMITALKMAAKATVKVPVSISTRRLPATSWATTRKANGSNTP